MNLGVVETRLGMHWGTHEPPITCGRRRATRGCRAAAIDGLVVVVASAATGAEEMQNSSFIGEAYTGDIAQTCQLEALITTYDSRPIA